VEVCAVKAAVCRAFGAPLLIEDLLIAPPGPGEVAVAVRACAICHSDIHAAEGSWGGELPTVFGHEAAGVVREVGPAVEGIAAGDHVIVTLIRSCGRCRHCAAGAPVRCRADFALDEPGPLTTPGGERVAQGINCGAFAEQVVVHASQLAVIDPSIPFDVASLLGCGVITGFGAVVNTARVTPGSTVVVVGCGGVGMNAVQGAAAAGAGRVIAVDPSLSKRNAALSFGASDALDPTEGDLRAALDAIIGDDGADHVLITVGSTSAVEQGLTLVGRGGQLVVVGLPADGETARFAPADLAVDEQRIVGCLMGSTRLPVDIPMLLEHYRAGRLRLDELITARYPLEDINEAIAAVNRGEALRNVIVFGG
jgi:S-(hydroxymethyl)glutathione dehydrogenase/alcohol dehydrogenase